MTTKSVDITIQPYVQVANCLPHLATLLRKKDGPELDPSELAVFDGDSFSRSYMSRKEHRDLVVSTHGFLNNKFPFVWIRRPRESQEDIPGFGITIYRAQSSSLGCTSNECLMPPLQYAVVSMPNPAYDDVCDFFVTAPDDRDRFIKHLLDKHCEALLGEHPPILEDKMLESIFDDTIQFLKHLDTYQKYGERLVRSVLFHGPGGNGKSMTCRWIKRYCLQNDISSGNITSSQIEERYAEGRPLGSLLSRYTVTFFDDIDISLMSRKDGKGEKACDLLSAMNGVEDSENRVRIFTTNEKIESLDDSFFRPGRIDASYEFKAPTRELRERVIKSWHPDILGAIHLETLLDESEGFSFAELKKVKTTMITRQIRTGKWDQDEAIASLKGMKKSKKRQVGFIG